MADVLEGCAVDASHQPAIYAAFIREIVRKTRESRMAATDALPDASTLLDLNGDALSALNGFENSGALDPTLLNDAANWTGPDMLSVDGQQFAFIPQGGDMM